MNDLAVVVRGLYKSYGSVEAVRGIDLEVSRGQVFAFLGPNGAGKTTTVEILEGHRRRDSGEVTVLGYDPADSDMDFLSRIGIVLQTTSVEPYLTVKETLEVFGGYYPHPRPVDETLELVGLVEHKNTRARKLSGGLQRRLDVAIGLIGDPELLFLDEPTTGFDPVARREAWAMIRNLRSLDKTVFLTTHYLDEAENLADRVAIIVEGKIAALGSPQDLIRIGNVTSITFMLPSQSPPLPAEFDAEPAATDGLVSIRTSTPTATMHLLTGWAVAQNVELEDLTVSRPSLEDVYLELVPRMNTEKDAE